MAESTAESLIEILTIPTCTLELATQVQAHFYVRYIGMRSVYFEL